MHYFIRVSVSIMVILFSFCLCSGDEIMVWELPAGTKLADISGKSAWIKSDALQKKPNGLAIENDLLVVCAKLGEMGLVLHGKCTDVSTEASVEICFLDANGQAVAIKTINLVESKDGVQLDIGLTDGGSSQALLARDASSLKVTSISKVTSFCVRALMAVIFRPDFFDTAMIYHTSLPIFSQGWANVPVENYLFGLLNENAVAACAWNSKKVQVKLNVLSGEKEKSFGSLQLLIDQTDPAVLIGVIKSSQAFVSCNFQKVVAGNLFVSDRRARGNAVWRKTQFFT